MVKLLCDPSEMLCVYSELPLIRTPEMWPPLYSGHSEESQSITPEMSNQDTSTGPKGGQIRGSSLYVRLIPVVNNVAIVNSYI